MTPITLEDLERWEKALHTQYQFCADAIIARHSEDAPILEQLGSIRLAHLSILPLIKQLISYTKRLEQISEHREYGRTYGSGLEPSLCALLAKEVLPDSKVQESK